MKPLSRILSGHFSLSQVSTLDQSVNRQPDGRKTV